MTDTLASLAASFQRAIPGILVAARVVVDENAEALQEKWKSTWPWSGSKSLPHIGASITIDKQGGGSWRAAEIGPIKEGQGNLGHLIEWGTATSGAHPGGGPAATTQTPVFHAAMAAVAEAVLGGAGAGSSVGTATTSRPWRAGRP